jgi:hypothetical protein
MTPHTWHASFGAGSIAGVAPTQSGHGHSSLSSAACSIPTCHASPYSPLPAGGSSQGRAAAGCTACAMVIRGVGWHRWRGLKSRPSVEPQSGAAGRASLKTNTCQVCCSGVHRAGQHLEGPRLCMKHADRSYYTPPPRYAAPAALAWRARSSHSTHLTRNPRNSAQRSSPKQLPS